ncbi:MAG: HAD family hydrolase [Dehalococcoidia bacterium]
MDTVRAVLFDLDDTLTASNEFAAAVLSASAAEHGVAISDEDVRAHRGAVFLPMLQNVFGVERTQAYAIYDTYCLRYEEMMRGRLEPTRGADALLGTLRSRGIPLALVTNKAEALAGAVLDLFGWRDSFTILVGHDSSAGHKPDPDPALMALRTLGCEAQHAAFVGDSVSDMKCGRSAGITTVVGLAGTSTAEELIEAGATHVCHDLGQVLALLAPAAPGAIPTGTPQTS